MTKSKPDFIDRFLLAYAKDLEWKHTKPDTIMRRLCEEQIYGTATEEDPWRGQKFMDIAYGWLWGATKNSIKANCDAGLLKYRLDQVYKIVSVKQGWDA